MMTRAPLSAIVLISGRGSNLQAIIDAKAQNRLTMNLTAVISNKPDAKGLERAHKAGLPTYVCSSQGKTSAVYNTELLQLIESLTPDLIILAGYMKIIPSELIAKFRGRIINIHPSLLPSFPGLHAHEQALAKGVKITGCTVHFVDEGCDTGPIILQKSLAIPENCTADKLSDLLLPLEHEAYVEALSLYENQGLDIIDNRVSIKPK